MRSIKSRAARVLFVVAAISLIWASAAYAVNGGLFFGLVDLHLEKVDATLPTLTNVEQLTFFGVEYRNTADVDGSGTLSQGDTARIDGVFSVTSFVIDGAPTVPAGFGTTWEMTGTYVALKDTIISPPTSGTINYVTTQNVGIITLYVSTDMTKKSSAVTGLGYDDGTIVAQFYVQDGVGGSYKVIASFDGSRDMTIYTSYTLPGFFVPEIVGALFDSNLDADYDNNNIGGDKPVPTAWKYPTVGVNFPLSFYTLIDGSLRFGSIPSKSGCKFDDQDGDGEWDPGEPGLPGWTIHLTGTDAQGNPVSVTQITDAEGCYEFNVPFGTYRVCEEFQTDWTQTFPTGPAGGNIINCDDPDVAGDGWGYLVTLDANNPIEESNDFGNHRLPTGGCRMTGGHVKFYDDGTSLTVPGDAETYKVSQVTVKRGNKLLTQDQVTWYTLGGQIGAPQAACLSTPDTAFGNWEHVHHQGTVSWPAGSQQNPSFSWPAGSFSGGFAFHSGTASAPDEAYIKCITCADPGWCVQARCAPSKQIFWEGTGVFHNIDAGTTFPNSCTVQTAGKNKPPTIHYYRAHVGDFGEPAGSNQQQKPADQCGWASAGVSILNGILDGVTVLPWPLDLKFGDKGGQNCSSYPNCTKCGECPDWYEIEIHCDASPASPIIYKVANFITHGNHQIHPEVGQQCPY